MLYSNSSEFNKNDGISLLMIRAWFYSYRRRNEKLQLKRVIKQNACQAVKNFQAAEQNDSNK